MKDSVGRDLSSKGERILIVDPDPASRHSLEELLRSAGYEVASSALQSEGFQFVRDAGVDLLLLAADIADVQCCDALSEVKGNAATAGTRVILLIRGGGAERARGLDLVADEGREMAQTAFQALAVTEKMTRDAFSLERALKIGVSALFAVAILIVGIFFLYSRRAEKETRRAYSVIAQIERGTRRQDQLVSDARSARADPQQTDVLQQKQQLQQESEELRRKLAAAEAGEVSSLRKQLDDTTSRLRRMETESQTAEGVIRAYAPSVCLLHVSVSFVDRSSGRPLRYGGIAPDGGPLKDSEGNPVYTLEGSAPEVRADFFGTGFVVGDDRILTNHHVVQPWWKNDELSSVLEQGLNPAIAQFEAYFPDAPAGVRVSISQISDQADLALVKGDLSGLKRPILKLDARKEAAVSGQPLISLGYATGLSAILARAGEE